LGGIAGRTGGGAAQDFTMRVASGKRETAHGEPIAISSGVRRRKTSGLDKKNEWCSHWKFAKLYTIKKKKHKRVEKRRKGAGSQEATGREENENPCPRRVQPAFLGPQR